MAARTIAICDACKKEYWLGGCRGSQELADFVERHEGWRVKSVYEEWYLCEKCKEAEDAEEE